MASQDKDAASLEMRVAAIEDKLAKMNITEEEMQAFNKVSSIIGTPGNVGLTPTPDAVCSVCQPSVCQPTVCQPIARFRGWPITRIPRFNCWAECQPISRGGLCDPMGGAGGGDISGGGFGGFGF